MSGITISHGSVVEVDTHSLRDAAGALERLARELDDLVGRALRALELSAAGLPFALAAGIELSMLHGVLREAAREADETAERVRSAAVLYEAVELFVERDAAAAAGDLDRVERVDRRLDHLRAQDPTGVERGRTALDHAPTIEPDLYGQLFLGTQVASPVVPWVLLPIVLGTVSALQRGRVASGARLAPASTPVSVRAGAARPVQAPDSLAAAAARIPTGGGAQVRVERYAMRDGSNQFAVYVAGTRSDASPDDPFDMRSNVELYGGRQSASYTAVEAALREAGARPGDTLHAFGHSQGAMVLERLALEGEYDTRTLVSFGAPVQADVGDATLSVSVRHTDDPVAALQANGHATGVGAPGSFVVERSADSAIGLHDLGMPAHHMAAYAETAAMVDASTDPRVDGVRDLLSTLAAAPSATTTDYSAARISPRDGGDAE